MWWWGLAALAAPPTLAEREAAGLRAIEPRAEAPAPPVVLTGGTIWTAAGPRIEGGYLVLTDGKVSAVGAGAPPQVPGARVIDLAGAHVTPGLIDTHSHLGVYPSPDAGAHGDGNEATAPTTPGVWAEHSAWPQDPGFARAIAGGVTTLQLLPGSANLVGGRGVVMRPVPARGSRAMRLEGAPETVKLACGENPKRVYGQRGGPSTRMGNLRGQREAFLAAQAYQRRWADWEAKLPAPEEPGAKKKKKGDPPAEPPPPPDRDLDLDTLVGVLEGRILPQVHCYRADDMLAMLQVADEFGFSVRSFHHATEAYKIADLLAARGVAASVWADWWGFKLEAWDAIPQGAALLEVAGARPVIHSDSAIGIQRLNQEASKAMWAGRHAGLAVDEEDAIRWVTANPAWALGVEDQVGTLEVGKRADVVVWDRDPLSVYASARWVFVDGALRWDAERPAVWSDFLLGEGVTP